MVRLVKASIIIILVVVVSGLLLMKAAARPEAPVQPIEFDHWQHVTKEEGPQLECTFCHENVDKSSHATIPNATTTCMACHESIKTESPEVQKLAALSQKNEQPAWIRVYWIEKSANVFYTHKPHIKAGLECVTCHGRIGEMHRVRREVNQSMGWCVECHRQRGVSIDCYVCHR